MERISRKYQPETNEIGLFSENGWLWGSKNRNPMGRGTCWATWGHTESDTTELSRIEGWNRKGVVRWRKSDISLSISSVQFSHSVVSDSLWPHESQHARPPCASPTPGVHSDSRPSSQWCHPAISSSVFPFSSCPQSLPASESFAMSQLFAWGGQSTGASASASFPPKKSEGWYSEWTGWVSLLSKGLSRVFSNTAVQKYQFFGVQLSHPYMTTGNYSFE